MSDIQAGDVVVCVSKRFTTCAAHRAPQSKPGSGVLKVGRYYTVARVVAGDFGGCGHRAIALVEVVSPISPVGFCPGCLRKVDSYSDDIALIERIRKCKPAKVTANA